MVEFLRSLANVFLDPVVLGGGVFAGYLFYTGMNKLAWTLLLCVLPGLGSVGSSNSHGLIYNSTTELIAAGIVSAASYRIMEYRVTRARPSDF
jgi:hypothetical protein